MVRTTKFNLPTHIVAAEIGKHGTELTAGCQRPLRGDRLRTGKARFDRRSPAAALPPIFDPLRSSVTVSFAAVDRASDYWTSSVVLMAPACNDSLYQHCVVPHTERRIHAELILREGRCPPLTTSVP